MDLDGEVGRLDAAVAATGEAGRGPSQLAEARTAAVAGGSDRVDLRPSGRGNRGNVGLSRGPAAAVASPAAEVAGAQEAPPGTQPRVTAEELPGIGAALPARGRHPVHPNSPEQDVRRTKVHQNISGGYRSAQGAHDVAMLHSVLSNARKQGRNRLEALLQGPEVLFAVLHSLTASRQRSAACASGRGPHQFHSASL